MESRNPFVDTGGVGRYLFGIEAFLGKARSYAFSLLEAVGLDISADILDSLIFQNVFSFIGSCKTFLVKSLADLIAFFLGGLSKFLDRLRVHGSNAGYDILIFFKLDILNTAVDGCDVIVAHVGVTLIVNNTHFELFENVKLSVVNARAEPVKLKHKKLLLPFGDLSVVNPCKLLVVLFVRKLFFKLFKL